MGGALGCRRHLPVRSHEGPRPDLLDRHATAHREWLAPHGLGVRLRPDRHDRPLPPNAGRRGLLPDGLGRQRARDGASRPELLRRALRPDAAVRSRLRSAREAGQASNPDRSSELRGALRRARGGGRAEVRRAVALPRPLRRLGDDVHDDRRALPARVAARVPAQPRARRGVPSRSADALGRRRPHCGRAGRARGPRAGGGVPRDRVPRRRWRCRHRDRDHPSRADPGVRRAGRPPRGRSLPSPVRHRRDHAVVRREGPGARARAGRSREGLGHRDDLHLRRHDRRRLVARAAAPDAQRDGARRAPGGRAARVGERRAQGRGELRRARGQDRQAGAGPDRRAPRRVGRAGG